MPAESILRANGKRVKNVYSLNIDVKKIKIQATNCEKIFTNHVSSKGLVSRVYKELSVWVRVDKNMNRYLTNEDIGYKE